MSATERERGGGGDHKHEMTGGREGRGRGREELRRRVRKEGMKGKKREGGWEGSREGGRERRGRGNEAEGGREGGRRRREGESVLIQNSDSQNNLCLVLGKSKWNVTKRHQGSRNGSEWVCKPDYDSLN